MFNVPLHPKIINKNSCNSEGSFLSFPQISDGSSKTSASEKDEELSVTMPAVGSSSTPKKLSMMAVSEKEMLLDWDVGVTSEETLVPGDKAAQQHEDQVNRGCDLTRFLPSVV